jgi:N-acetylmuramoyl-L-alanine amidase
MLPRPIRRWIPAVAALLGGGLGLRAQTPAPTAPPAKAKVSSLSTTYQAGSKRSPLSDKPDWKQLESFSGVMSREEFEAAFAEIYSDGTDAKRPWELTPGKLVIETGPGEPPVEIAFRDPAAGEKSVPRYWRAPRELPPIKPDEPPLKGMHIALDPGHIGGGYAVMEERWLSMLPDTAIAEGSIVLQVAMLIKPRLEALGARVSLLRTAEVPVTTVKPEQLRTAAREVLKEAGVTSPPDSYAGITGDAKVATVQWQAEKLFYRVSEIHARAKKVNEELQPNLVVCLHLNAEPWGDPSHPTFVNKNHFHALINGCYSGDELELEDVRFDMFQRLFARLHDEERRLGETVAAAMAESTGLPYYVYTANNARHVKPSPYLYARNLLANRLYQCPVVYLEPYVMNHEETYKRLLLGHYIGRALLDGKLVTSPMEDYTRGVVEGLVAYCKQERRVAP